MTTGLWGILGMESIDDLKALNIKTFRKKEGRLPTLEEQETAYVQWVLKETHGNKTPAAQILGIDRASL